MSPVLIKAIFLQYSGIVGAGIFALPYVLSRSNFYYSSLGLILTAFIIGLVNYFYSHVILHTKGDHQLPGYCRLYLNPRFESLAFINLLLLYTGVLTAYLKLSSSLLSRLFPTLSHSLLPWFFIIVVYLLFTVCFRLFSYLSHLLPLAVLFFVVLLYYFSLIYHPFPIAPTAPFHLSYLGAAIFALAGFTVIPEVEEYLRLNGLRPRLYRASLAGLGLAVLTSLLFAFSLTVLSGPFLSPDSATGLALVSPALAGLLAFLGIFAILKSSVNALTVLKEVFYRDLKLKPASSYLITCLIPLVSLYLTNLSFVQIISLTGSVTIFITVILISLLYLHVRPRPSSYLLVLLVLVFFTIGLYLEFFPI